MGNRDMCSGCANLESFTSESPLMIEFRREHLPVPTVSGRLPATSKHCSLPRGNMCPSTSDLSDVMIGHL